MLLVHEEGQDATRGGHHRNGLLVLLPVPRVLVLEIRVLHLQVQRDDEGAHGLHEVVGHVSQVVAVVPVM